MTRFFGAEEEKKKKKTGVETCQVHIQLKALRTTLAELFDIAVSNLHPCKFFFPLVPYSFIFFSCFPYIHIPLLFSLSVPVIKVRTNCLENVCGYIVWEEDDVGG
jgi:hypothetical protein